MTKNEAKRKIETLLESDAFNYIHTKTLLYNGEINLAFKMDSKNYGLQMTFNYYESYCDILIFIDPVVLNEEHYIETLQTINYINNWAKAFGRFYLDEHNDIAYSLRIPYSLLEQMSDKALEEIDTGIKYYEDVFLTLIDVAKGKATYQECRDFIDEMWGHTY